MNKILLKSTVLLTSALIVGPIIANEADAATTGGDYTSNGYLGGQQEQYLVKQLQDFRAGRRSDEQMTIIAEGLDGDASPRPQPGTPR